MQDLGNGALDKMAVELDAPVRYRMRLGEQQIPLNERLGSTLRIRFLGLITCCHCGRHTSKSFGQGYCFPCFKRLARCDSCIVKPETCHFERGTCREPDWAGDFCMQPHLVYLANSSGLKVGITRSSQVPTRWIDQGAVQALPILRVATRQQSGLTEVLLRESVADKTNWRQMLRGESERVDLAAEAAKLLARYRQGLENLRLRFGADAISRLGDAAEVRIDYPVLQYPDKPRSLNLEKNGGVEGTLLGIKGQYLIFDTGVLNVRNLTSYHVQLSG